MSQFIEIKVQEDGTVEIPVRNKDLNFTAHVEYDFGFGQSKWVNYIKKIDGGVRAWDSYGRSYDNVDAIFDEEKKVFVLKFDWLDRKRIKAVYAKVGLN